MSASEETAIALSPLNVSVLSLLLLFLIKLSSPVRRLPSVPLSSLSAVSAPREPGGVSPPSVSPVEWVLLDHWEALRLLLVLRERERVWLRLLVPS